MSFADLAAFPDGAEWIAAPELARECAERWSLARGAWGFHETEPRVHEDMIDRARLLRR